MRLDLLVTTRSIIPATEEDAHRLRMIPPGFLLPVEMSKARNGAFHRKLMALAGFIAKNHPRFSSIPQVMRELKYRTGHFEEFVTRGGVLLWEPRSISYSEMDGGDFDEWAGRAIRVIFDELWPEMDEALADAEARREMAAWERAWA